MAFATWNRFQYVIYNENMFHTPEILGKVINLYLANNVWLEVPRNIVVSFAHYWLTTLGHHPSIIYFGTFSSDHCLLFWILLDSLINI